MRRHGRVPLALVCGLLAGLAVPAAQAQRPPVAEPLSVEVGARAVTVRGASPGGRVLLVAVAQATEHHLTSLVRREVVLTADGREGTATLALGEPVPLHSVWSAVELATGKAAVGTPKGFARRELSVSPGAASPAGDSLTFMLPLAEIVLARPGTGAWAARVGDGGESDRDRSADGSVRAGLADMRSLDEAPPPPDALSAGDVVLVIDPLELRFAVLRLEGRGGRSS